MDPFHKTVMMCFNGHQHRKSSKDFYIFIFFKCMYIYNTILYIISPLHQITKNLVNANARVFLMQRVNLALFSLLTAVISLSQFFPFLKVVKTLLRRFSFAISANGSVKNIFVIPSHSLLSTFTNWRLPLLRNPEMWKRSIMWYVT